MNLHSPSSLDRKQKRDSVANMERVSYLLSVMTPKMAFAKDRATATADKYELETQSLCDSDPSDTSIEVIVEPHVLKQNTGVTEDSYAKYPETATPTLSMTSSVSTTTALARQGIVYTHPRPFSPISTVFSSSLTLEADARAASQLQEYLIATATQEILPELSPQDNNSRKKPPPTYQQAGLKAQPWGVVSRANTEDIAADSVTTSKGSIGVLVPAERAKSIPNERRTSTATSHVLLTVEELLTPGMSFDKEGFGEVDRPARRLNVTEKSFEKVESTPKTYGDVFLGTGADNDVPEDSAYNPPKTKSSPSSMNDDSTLSTHFLVNYSTHSSLSQNDNEPTITPLSQKTSPPPLSSESEHEGKKSLLSSSCYQTPSATLCLPSSATLPLWSPPSETNLIRDINQVHRAQAYYQRRQNHNLRSVPRDLIGVYERECEFESSPTYLPYDILFEDRAYFPASKLEVSVLLQCIRKYLTQVVSRLQAEQKTIGPGVSKFRVTSFDGVTKNVSYHNQTTPRKQSALIKLIQNLHLSPFVYDAEERKLQIVVSSLLPINERLLGSIRDFLDVFVTSQYFTVPGVAQFRVQQATNESRFQGVAMVSLTLPRYRAGAASMLLKQLLHHQDEIVATNAPTTEEGDILATSYPMNLIKFYFVVRIATGQMPDPGHPWSAALARLKVLAGHKWCTEKVSSSKSGSRSSCLMYTQCDKCGMKNRIFSCVALQ
ncbi:hypothetical protein BABINDRAFT_159239 [Babjeviella inositovora NRRL Y-12698]|uniref:Uncharacterized protein n=1 Tax=Babjeviella inositovora NRRL Y-12698 TaxID=984486 RepID=A0A1E3QYT5_9ASCO|nr:uncharacterized protein BABINDRAFT_159239 [Babjeviella inositovora NRRL Y-12698]ODQ82714.1 hypothetical protein BABINDRAFT_159239 [Babjeviella inositovora NRRL Y-12698]